MLHSLTFADVMITLVACGDHESVLQRNQPLHANKFLRQEGLRPENGRKLEHIFLSGTIANEQLLHQCVEGRWSPKLTMLGLRASAS